MLYRLRRSLWHLLPKLNIEYVYSHNLEIIPEKKFRIDAEIIFLTKDNIHRIHEVKKINLQKLTKRLERGDKCYATVVDGKIAGYQWVQYSGIHFIQQAGKKVKVKEGDFWIYHARVLESYRSNGINSKIKSELMKDAKANNFKRALIYTNKNNIPNRKGLERLGFTLEDIIYSLKINNRFYKVYNKSMK